VSKQRKPLNQILEAFDEGAAPPTGTPAPEAITATDTNSLAAKLAKPSRKKATIRFTLDLEKPLDNRLTKSATKLNRSKADLVRFAVERLLEELEA
jgi:hypothetical protein